MLFLFSKIARHPDHGSVDQLVEKGDRARDARRWALASASYGEAVDLDPKRYWIWIQYGHALKELGQLTKAETSYRRALSLNPNDSDGHLQLGHVLKLQGAIREAADNYLRALCLEPELAAARNELLGLGFTPTDVNEAVTNQVLSGRPYLEDRPSRNWETVAENLQRFRIERGWLFRTHVIGTSNEVSCAMTFVPD